MITLIVFSLLTKVDYNYYIIKFVYKTSILDYIDFIEALL